MTETFGMRAMGVWVEKYIITGSILGSFRYQANGFSSEARNGIEISRGLERSTRMVSPLRSIVVFICEILKK